ncbi:bromodomain-containing protein 8 [Venturia canescens]|uniref:bromodomain-containing protein 8 n=1 Tax=Venturia canescens TaxID=32260 RepID=UPI001C9C14F5|nr:bromodomain-containing protein 8 [Venturia canescens]XP_043266870.1 bromodomain-containing protein 8 [Venturia canescens]XP_043266871.1 bromodomain-containing protein 8 [Venturia canescens]
MASVQERNKLKRVSYDTWSTREQLCLATSVLKSGDQNWMGVSRSLKPFAEKEALRPPDWFSQKSCAIQYAILIENADAPKRKKRESGETTGESIVRRLTQERIAELGQILAFQRDEYQQLKAEVNLLRSGTITDEKLQKMWLSIEQEEREQEQKCRAHAAWLAKRQQKQEVQASMQTVTIASPRKSLEATSETQENSESMNEEEEKKNRGGRSPLLTSLLKSPSPTTQMQNPTSSAQVNSPTIASLLGSSPKVPSTQISTSIPSQLHQLVSSTLTNTVNERPSAGAPTLSMLLELPANLQRASLASLQQTASSVQQQIAPPEIHIQSHPIKHTIPQNESLNVKTSTVPASIPVTENMVQIIDQVDDVIRKDIMADVINKDEINEIIGDLEELIKEEITASPQKAPLKMMPTIPVVVENLNVPQVEKLVQERLEPRDVDEPVSLSNSPQSEMAIEEIDQSTSSIAEIIGTIAIEPVEPKVSVAPVIAEESSKVGEKINEEVEVNQQEIKVEEEIVQEQTKTEKKSVEEREIADQSEKEENNIEQSSPTIEKPTEKMKPVETEKTEVEPEKKCEDMTPKIESKGTVSTVETSQENVSEKENNETLLSQKSEAIPVENETNEKPVGDEKLGKEKVAKNDMEIDQIELNLAKITGDQTEVGSAEVVSVSSEVTTDVPSIEDNEKSQDISTILEDDESFQSNSSKKKDTDEQSSVATNMVDNFDSQESSKDEPNPKEATTEETANEILSKVESPKEEVSVAEKNGDETIKVEDSKDSEATTTSEASQEVEKKEKIEEATSTSKVEEKKSEVEKIEVELKAEKEETEKIEEKVEKIVKEDNEDEEKEGVKEEKIRKGGEVEESSKPEVQEVEEKKCVTPIPFEEKPEIKDESDTDSSIKQLDESKKEEIELKEEKEDEEKTVENEIKKETVESSGSICDDIGDLDEEESSLSKLSGGRAMKTYSKKQTIAVDSEPENESSGENADYRAWKKAVMLVYNRLATHKYASLFLRPITEDQAPGYHSVIFRPMDLSTIKKNIDNGTIRSTMHFQRDVMLMFQNAIMYNKQDTFVYKMALSMQEECLQHMQILVQVTGEGQLRRETRTAASSSSETSDSSVKRKRSHITPSPHDTDSPRGKKRRKSEND